MAKTVEVKLKEDSDWIEVEVANFYTPELHNTVRFGANDKQKYAYMRIAGKVYNKLKESWVDDIDPVKKIPYVELDCLNNKLNVMADGCVEVLTCDNIHYISDIVEVMSEINRVVATNGEVHIKAPIVPNKIAFNDPRIKSYVTEETFKYFHKQHPNCIGEGFSRCVVQVINQHVQVWFKK